LENHHFRLEFSVRDYECDLAGMVNNASYLHYIEHARHEFLKRKNIDFAQLAERGVFLVVTRIELDFLHSLRSGDRFYVLTHVGRVSRLRFGFEQSIYRIPDDRPILKAKVIGTSVDKDGKPKIPSELLELISEI
jgi:acyl-CoA thioester hydrolase